jgi:hypothetical protein
MFNPLSHRCCQHNHSHGWPYFSEHLWMASNDNGIVATLYSASSVTAKVGDGTLATIKEVSNYPFEDEIQFTVDTGKKANQFPIYLRLPEWCDSPSILVNGKRQAVALKPGGYARIDRPWVAGDKISLKLPMEVSTQKWTKNHDSVSLNYGPLTFALKITEGVTKMDSTKTALGDSRWQTDLDTTKWSAFEYRAQSPWNVALALNPNKPLTGVTVVKKVWPKSGFPFTPDEVPIKIELKGAILPEWKLDKTGLVSTLQSSPTKSSQPTKTFKLIPMGAARLRISAFPWLAPNGKKWVAAPTPFPYSPTASHVFEGDSIEAICDNILPKSSGDQSIPRLTFWDHKGTSEWIEYHFKKSKSVKEIGVYWFDDTGRGQCRIPKSWRVFGKVGGQWEPMPTEQAPGVLLNQFNTVKIGPVAVMGLRIEVELKPGFSAGILEWRVK